MKTRKLLFTMIAAMTMVFGLTLTAHAEEAAPAPTTKVVGVEGIGTFTVPADWTDGEYIDNCGTFWFNPTGTAYVGVSTTKAFEDGLAPIEVFAPIYKRNMEANGITIIDWQVTKYFGHDAIYHVGAGQSSSDFIANHPAFYSGYFECAYDYYSGNSIPQSFSGAASIEDFQMTLPILATYKPAQ